MTSVYKMSDSIYQGPLPHSYEKLAKEVSGPLAVVSLIEEMPLQHEETTYTADYSLKSYVLCKFPILDGPFPGLNWLTTVVRCMEALEKGGYHIYVHCWAGMSRSAMVTAAYLMKKHKWNRDKTLDYMASINSKIDPSHSFILGLNEWHDHHPKIEN